MNKYEQSPTQGIYKYSIYTGIVVYFKQFFGAISKISNRVML
jgi:hypothetical protein